MCFFESDWVIFKGFVYFFCSVGKSVFINYLIDIDGDLNGGVVGCNFFF